jgi:hypothetical protein
MGSSCYKHTPFSFNTSEQDVTECDKMQQILMAIAMFTNKVIWQHRHMEQLNYAAKDQTVCRMQKSKDVVCLNSVST